LVAEVEERALAMDLALYGQALATRPLVEQMELELKGKRKLMPLLLLAYEKKA
jgi:hypothetical protein